MTLNCRTSHNDLQDNPVYSTSALGGDYVDIWIQDPISQQPYDPTLDYSIKGIYAQVKAHDLSLPKLDAGLVDEFAAWEAASDEALIKFEQEL